jgi:small subunit ribosomal protein S16
MLSLKLSRVGKKSQPVYRLVVVEKSKDPWGRVVENIGTFNPLMTPPKIEFNAERVKYWVSKGAQPSDTVWNMLVDQKLVEGAKRLKVKISKARKAKMAKKAA